MSHKLEEYFKAKNEYMKDYSLVNEDKVITVMNIKTNMPVKFYEKNGEYIVEIVDNKDSTKVYYRRKLINKKNINLSFLYEKIKQELEDLNVEFKKVNYLNRIDEINEKRSKIESIKNTLLNPNNDIELLLQQVNEEYNILKLEFEQWYSNIKKVLTKIDIITQIYNEYLDVDRNSMNEYTMGYYWLNSKIGIKGDSSVDDTHYIMSKLIIQSGNIKEGYVLKYADIWHIVTGINGSQLTIQNLRVPFDTKSVNSRDVIYNQGSYHVFKDYKMINGNTLMINESVIKLPDGTADSIVAKLTYQNDSYSVDDIVLYNNNWYMINGIEGDNLVLR